MDRSRRQGASGTRTEPNPPVSSRLTVRRTKNRRRPGTMWSRLPKPQAFADACGRALRRAAPAMAALVAIGAAGGGVWAGYRWLLSSPRFAITAIEVRGAHHLDPDALRDALPIHTGDNVFADLTAIARVVRAQPWVASADVRRILPHTITIDIREHTAAGVLALGEPDSSALASSPRDTGALYLIDDGGVPFKRAADSGETAGLPLITGLGRAAYLANPVAAAATARQAIAAVAGWQTAQRPAIREVHLDTHGAITLRTREPALAIQLGALGGEVTARMHTFDTAWAALSDAERSRARAVHLGARTDHVTVAFAKD